MKSINIKVMPVANYVVNVCSFTYKQLDQQDKVTKQELKKGKMHGAQPSIERLYINRDHRVE